MMLSIPGYALFALLILLPGMALEKFQPLPPQDIASSMCIIDGLFRFILVTMKHREVTISSQDDLMLECQIVGRPPPQTFWLAPRKNNERVVQVTKSLNSTTNPRGDMGDGPIKLRLYLNCVTPEDSGEYLCVAENENCLVWSSTKVTVQPADRPQTPSCVSSTSSKKPEIILLSKKRLQFFGRGFKFICRASNDPNPSIEWFRVTDEHEIKISEESDEYKVLPNGDLVIREVQWENADYACVAKNVHGMDRFKPFFYQIAPGPR